MKNRMTKEGNKVLECSCVLVFLMCENRRRSCLFIHTWGCNNNTILNFRIQYMPFNCYNSQLNCLNSIQSIDFKIELYNSSKWLRSCYKSFEFKNVKLLQNKFKRKLKTCHASLVILGWHLRTQDARAHTSSTKSVMDSHPLCARVWREPLSLKFLFMHG